MCLDYIDLNKACQNDDFPLQCIDQLVDSMTFCELMSFIDAYSGYHQVWMAKEVEKKPSFITRPGTFYYVRMQFRLKNACTTFTRLVNKTLAHCDGADFMILSIDLNYIITTTT